MGEGCEFVLCRVGSMGVLGGWSRIEGPSGAYLKLGGGALSGLGRRLDSKFNISVKKHGASCMQAGRQASELLRLNYAGSVANSPHSTQNMVDGFYRRGIPTHAATPTHCRASGGAG